MRRKSNRESESRFTGRYGRLGILRYLERLLMDTSSFTPEVKHELIEGTQLFHEIGHLADGGAKVTRTIELSKKAGKTIALDELKKNEKIEFHFENTLSYNEDHKIFLESSIGLCSFIHLYYSDYNFGESPGAVSLTFDHLIDASKPVCLADTKNFQMDIHHNGVISYLDASLESSIQRLKFNPKKEVKVVYLEDVAVTIYLKLSGFYGADLIICKH